MSDVPNDAAPQVVDRKELLAQQFDEVEQVNTDPAPTDKPDRARDESGRFAKTEAEKIAAAVEKTPAAPVTAAPQGEPLVEEPAWKKPPTSWKKDYYDLYGSIDPKLQQYVWDRETQMRAGVEPLLPKAKFADEISAVIEPYLPTIRGLGIEAPRAIQSLMHADYSLRTLPHQQKVQYAAQLLGQYGIDLNQLQGQPQGQVVDQNYYALQNELIGLRGALTGLTQAQEQQQTQVLQNEISSFAQKNEYYEIARPFMVPLLQKQEAISLQEAYEKVTGPGGVLHDLISARSQAASQKQNSAQADAAAKAARKAAVSVKGTTPGTPAPSKAQDRRSMLLEQFDNVSERL